MSQKGQGKKKEKGKKVPQCSLSSLCPVSVTSQCASWPRTLHWEYAAQGTSVNAHHGLFKKRKKKIELVLQVKLNERERVSNQLVHRGSHSQL